MTDTTKIIALVGVIIFGAITHASLEYKKSRTQPDYKLERVDIIVLFVIAIFSGIMFSMIAIAFSAPDMRIGIAGATGSVLGFIGLDAISKKLLDIFINMATQGK